MTMGKQPDSSSSLLICRSHLHVDPRRGRRRGCCGRLRRALLLLRGRGRRRRRGRGGWGRRSGELGGGRGAGQLGHDDATIVQVLLFLLLLFFLLLVVGVVVIVTGVSAVATDVALRVGVALLGLLLRLGRTRLVAVLRPGTWPSMLLLCRRRSGRRRTVGDVLRD